jgi:acyl-CoA synthetase
MFPTTQSPVVLQCSPLTFDPSMIELFLSRHTNGDLVIFCPGTIRQPDILAQSILESGADWIQMTPTLWSRFSKYQQTEIIQQCKNVLLGGESFPLDLAADVQHQVGGCQWWNLYGTTECSVWATLQNVREVLKLR